MHAAYLLSFFAELLLCGQASLWFPLFGFSHLAALLLLLVSCMVGVLLGLRMGARFAASNLYLWEVSGFILLAASFFSMLSPWFYATFVQVYLRVMVGGMLVVLMAMLATMIFPIAVRLDTSLKNDDGLGLAFVLAVAGALFGLVLAKALFYFFSIGSCFAFFAMVALGVSLLCFNNERMQPIDQVITKLFVAVMCGFILLQELVQLFSHTSQAAVQLAHSEALPLSGSVDLATDALGGVFIFRGDHYDVQAGLDPLVGRDPALLLTLLRVPPKNILMVGLSARAWLKLMTQFPGVEKIDVVGINLGHLAAINTYLREKRLVMDSRVHLSVDDTRRWLRRHPKDKYDLIVENTACYWRACATRLLSREMNALTRERLQSEGVVAYNTVGAGYVLRAGIVLFLSGN